MLLSKRMNVFKAVEVDKVSSEREVLLIKEYLELHEGGIFIPDPLVEVAFNPVN